MQLQACSALVTGAASGLGLASARRLVQAGVKVVMLDLPGSDGAARARELGAVFVPGDVTQEAGILAACEAATRLAPMRALVHCAGRGGPLRLLDREGNPAALEGFEAVVRVNLLGTFNVLRLAAAAMAKTEAIDGERGACVLTASVAAFEGQIGQLPYAASKSGIVGMTIVAARDLAQRAIRVCTIAPGIFETPMLAGVKGPMREALEQAVPHPSRLGRPEEFAALAQHILENPMLNGETIRLDGALRMAPR